MPKSGHRPSRSRTVSMTGVTAAGSPGPLRDEDPVRVERQHLVRGRRRRAPPRGGSRRRPGRGRCSAFMPQSMATTRGPSAPSPARRPGRRRGEVAAVQHRVRRARAASSSSGRARWRRPRAWRPVAQVAHQPAGVAAVDGHDVARASASRASPSRPPAARTVAGARHHDRPGPGAVALVAGRARRRSCRSSARRSRGSARGRTGR